MALFGGASCVVISVAHAGEFPTLPNAITSFGACVAGGSVYVYGGHSGEAHKYSLDTTLFDFQRIAVDGSGDWELLPGPARAQGASLVAWDGKLIRVGGLSARNQTIGEDENLVSLTDVELFDPTTERWSKLPDLPAPRSSHDSLVTGGRLYVVGGWELSGPRKGKWYDESWVLDLAHPDMGWSKFTQPFKRRAVAADAVGDWIVVLRGMDDANEPSLAVDLYNLKSKEWTRGPELPDGPMDGFGAAACVIGKTLYASTYAGKVFAWSPGDTAWSETAELKQHRFFHRMVPLPDNRLLLLGGASRKSGHMNSVEIVQLNPAAH